MSKARQSMKKVKVGKDVRQASNNLETMQEIEELETKGSLEQVIDAGANQLMIEELNRLIPLLKAALAELPKDGSENVMKVAKRAEAIAEEANKDKPDKEKLEITGESLLLAANNIANIAPTVLTIASQVVETISKLIH